jgi:hypothetical protein
MPCTEPNLVKTLTAKHARLQGLALRDGPDKHMLDIYHVESVIRMFSPDWTPAKPITPRGPKKLGRYGTVTRAGIAVLREADRPLSAREIAVRVLEREGRDDQALIWPIMGCLVTTLAKRKTVVRHEGRPLRWSLMQPAANSQPIDG